MLWSYFAQFSEVQGMFLPPQHFQQQDCHHAAH
jgi:predicted component of type VI protein secretion system